MVVTLDTETTGATNGTRGNPFSAENKLCLVGLLHDHGYAVHDIEYSNQPYGKCIDYINKIITGADRVIGFNLKFDLHWLFRYGIARPQRVWDCQLTQFILENQKHAYPSLNETASKYGLGSKLDVVKEEYWNNGIDTDQVPKEILESYLEQDVRLTYEVYLKQKEIVETLPKAKQRLISLVNQDLLVLAEMEWNGIYYNMEKSKAKAAEIEAKIDGIDERLRAELGGIPANFDSPKHISAVLYGGVIKENYRESYTFVYKDGRQTQKERWAIREHKLSPLVEPLKGTELKPDKDGNKLWSTDVDTLKKLKTDKKSRIIINLLLERSALEQLRGTYYDGFPNIYKKMNWEDNILHSQLNQVVAVTGRLSSKAPNSQNIPDEVRELIETRFS